jgi:hypothetical protein
MGKIRKHTFEIERFNMLSNFTHLLHIARAGEHICEFGDSGYAELLYRNKVAPGRFICITDAVCTLPTLPWLTELSPKQAADIIQTIKADKVVCLHTESSGSDKLDLQSFFNAGHSNAEYLISLSAEQRDRFLPAILQSFSIVKEYGLSAKPSELVPRLTGWQREAFNRLSEYYDLQVLANFFAPFNAQSSEKSLLILKRKK